MHPRSLFLENEFHHGELLVLGLKKLPDRITRLSNYSTAWFLLVLTVQDGQLLLLVQNLFILAVNDLLLLSKLDLNHILVDGHQLLHLSLHFIDADLHFRDLTLLGLLGIFQLVDMDICLPDVLQHEAHHGADSLDVRSNQSLPLGCCGHITGILWLVGRSFHFVYQIDFA